MFENKISILDKHFEIFSKQLKALDSLALEELLQYKEEQKNILIAQVKFLIKYLQKIPEDLDSLENISVAKETGKQQEKQLINLETTVSPLQLDETQAKEGSANEENETVFQEKNLGEEAVSESCSKYNLEVEKNLVAQYNDILRKDATNLEKEKMINEIWSEQGPERMSMPNIENVRALTSQPELKSGGNGNFYGIPQDSYYFIFPIPSVNVTKDFIQYTFDIEGNGEYIGSVEEAAKFDRDGDIVKLAKKGKIKAKLDTETPSDPE